MRRLSSTASGSSRFARRWSSRPSPAASLRSAASTWRRSSRTRASSGPRRGRAARAWPFWSEKETRRRKARPPPRPSLLPRRASPRPPRRGLRPLTLRPRGQKRRARRSTARPTRSCAPQRSSAHGSPAPRTRASSRSTPRRHSADPLQGELIGLSLAVKPGEACYIPIGHRTGADDLFNGAGLAPDQIAEAEAIALLKPLLEQPGVLKIGHDIKFDMHVLAMRGVRVAPIDDAMLLSYTLDAGATGDDHSIDTLSERFLGHKPIPLSEVAGSGRNFVGLARAPIEKACEYGAEKADIALRLRRVLQPRIVAERMTTVYERLERPLVEVLARMERRGIAIDRNILSRMTGEFSQRMAGLEDEINRNRRRALQPRLAETAWRHSVRPDGLARRQEDRDRRLVDHRERARGPRRRRPSIAGARARMAADLEAQVDLHRRAAGLRQSVDRPRPHGLRARLDDDRAPVVVGAESAEHSDPHRGRAQDPARLRRARRTQAHLGRLQPDRAQASRPSRRHSGAQARLRRRTRHSRHDRLGNVRRADRGHAERSATAGESDQFRHHLRHLGLRPRQPARHRPQRGGRLHQEIFRALPRHSRLHGSDEEDCARQRLCDHSVRPQVPLSAHQRLQSFGARVQRARRHQRAAAGFGRRHHPPRDGPHGRRSRKGGLERADAAHRPRRTGVRGAGR